MASLPGWSRWKGDEGGELRFETRDGASLMVLKKLLGRVGAHWPAPPTERPAEYYQKILSSDVDLLGREVLARPEDPSYEAVVDLLTPLGPGLHLPGG